MMIKHYFQYEFFNLLHTLTFKTACNKLIYENTSFEMGFVSPALEINCKDCLNSEVYKKDLITLELACDGDRFKFYTEIWKKRHKYG